MSIISFIFAFLCQILALVMAIAFGAVTDSASLKFYFFVFIAFAVLALSAAFVGGLSWS